MNKYRIAVTWEMCGYIDVESDTLEEAMQKVKDDPDDFSLPVENDYVDGSFGLSKDDVEEMRMICNFYGF